MNIRVDLSYPVKDGTEVVFRSPVDCSQVTGLKVYYVGADGVTGSQEFAFADAHGNNVGDIDHLFAENVAVKVILDVTTSMAFVQNADTNAYLEGRFSTIEEDLARAFRNGDKAVTIGEVTAEYKGGQTAGDYDELTAEVVKLSSKNNLDGVVLIGIIESTEPTSAVNKRQLDTNVREICPPFSESGSVVECTPLKGSPLRVVSRINAVQTGDGTPTPDNIRPFAPYTEAQLYQSNGTGGAEFVAPFGQTVYRGNFDWNTGMLTIEWAFEEIIAVQAVTSPGYAVVRTKNNVDHNGGKTVAGYCSHYKGGLWSSAYPDNYMYAANEQGFTVSDRTHFSTKASADEYLAAQKAAGTPVQVCYRLKTPIEVQLTKQEIKALSGVNTFQSSTGDTTVSGLANPAAVIEDLLTRISALEAAVVNNA